MTPSEMRERGASDDRWMMIAEVCERIERLSDQLTPKDLEPPQADPGENPPRDTT